MNRTATPLFTSDLPGVGGVAKQTPETFLVEEIEAYTPCGEGEHWYLWVEKRDVSAGQLVRQISERLGVADRDIGVAGNKDRRAITRQWVSVPALEIGEPQVGELAPGITILRVDRHSNKLRTNHLRGNRFVLELCELAVPQEIALERADAILAVLAERGAPNYFGEQRFGRKDSTFRMGLELLQGKTPGALRKNRRLKRLAASAAQSAVFNDVVRRRIEAHTTHTALLGDRLNRTTQRGQLVVTAENQEQAQRELNAGELAVTGPMIGPKMFDVYEEALAIEEAALAQYGLDRQQFAKQHRLTPGTRRDIFARFLEPPSLEASEDGIRIGFSLPSGSYATVVLAELIKLDFSSREAP